VSEVTSAQIAAYEPLCVKLARPLVGRNGAELDDLVQEGRIDVWQSLARGVEPAAHLVYARMVDYVRWLGRQTPIPYEAMLPLDDFREAAVQDVALPEPTG